MFLSSGILSACISNSSHLVACTFLRPFCSPFLGKAVFHRKVIIRSKKSFISPDPISGGTTFVFRKGTGTNFAFSITAPSFPGSKMGTNGTREQRRNFCSLRIALADISPLLKDLDLQIVFPTSCRFSPEINISRFLETGKPYKSFFST